MPFLSVVIPVYNGEKYLRQSVQSVLSQPHQDIQVVIVNDGSKDRSLSIANELSRLDSRVTVLDQINQGVSAARNAGIDYSIQSGAKYIAFLDADDAWVSGAIDETIVNQISQRQDVDIWGFGTLRSNSNMSRYTPPDAPISHASVYPGIK